MYLDDIIIRDWKSVHHGLGLEKCNRRGASRASRQPNTGRDRRNRGGEDVLGLAAQELVSNLPTSALSKGRDDDPLLHYSWPNKFNLAVK